MTTIASNAALSILSQPTPRLVAPAGADPARSPADTILAIVSAAAKGSVAKTTSSPAPAAPAATTEPAAAPRAVGGSVSSEPSKAQLGAMAAAGAMTTTYDPIAAANGFLPIKASVENAEAFIRHLARQIEQYNDGLNPDVVWPTREEYNATYQKWAEKRIAAGDDPKVVSRDVAYFTSDDYYSGLVDKARSENSWRKSDAFYARSAIDTSRHLLSEVFNQNDVVEKDETGRFSLKNLNICYSNGSKMVIFDNNNGLTTFNEDGSVRGRYSLEDIRSI